MKVTINKNAKIFEIAEIIYKLRLHTKYWQKHYGSDNRRTMKYWEDKADKWIEDSIKF